MLKRNSINVHSHTQPLVKSRKPAGRTRDFGNFLKGFAKSQRLIVLNIAAADPHRFPPFYENRSDFL